MEFIEFAFIMVAILIVLIVIGITRTKKETEKEIEKAIKDFDKNYEFWRAIYKFYKANPDLIEGLESAEEYSLRINKWYEQVHCEGSADVKYIKDKSEDLIAILDDEAVVLDDAYDVAVENNNKKAIEAITELRKDIKKTL